MFIYKNSLKLIMRRGNKLILSFFIITILSTTAVFAADVAYIYRHLSRVDENVLEIFGEMNLQVDLINEKNMPDNFANYKFLYIGDENYRKEKLIPVNNYSAIVTNYYHGEVWGLTHDSGISKLGATSPLKVLNNGNEIKVYNKAFKRNRLAISYYYLNNKSKAEPLQQIAATQPTSSGLRFGDVISYAEAGSQMADFVLQKGNLCFFGIAESNYWTDEAKELFKDCISFALEPAQLPPPQQIICSSDNDCNDNNSTTIDICKNPGLPESFCQNDNPLVINCFSNSDCPAEHLSELFCFEGTIYLDDNIYQTKTTYSCESPGTENSACVSNDELVLVTDCNFGCQNAQCLSPDLINNHDIALLDLSNSIGKIRLEKTSGEDILDEILMCNEKYKISILVDNLGNFTENVSFLGSINGIDFNHNPIEDFAPEDSTKLKTKTVNFTLDEGDYTINIEAIIDGFTDNNPEDNGVMRNISIICQP
jgi:hypothetical protein